MSRPVWHRFESILADPITRYLAAKRSLGYRFGNEERALRLLDRYLCDQGVRRIAGITGECLEAFLVSRPRRRANSYNHLLGVVRRLFKWMVDRRELAASPLKAQARPATTRRLPFLFDPKTVRLLLARARELPDNPRSPQRGATYATIFALLAGLGLRVGEVSRVQCGDIDLKRKMLLVRDSQSGKSRLVALGPRLATRLRAYVDLRERRLGVATAQAPFFSWNGRSAVQTNSIRNTFRDDLLPLLRLEVPSGTRAPSLHGLRHTSQSPTPRNQRFPSRAPRAIR